MSDNEKPSAAAEEVRLLAGEGSLADRFRDGSDDQRRRLRGGAAEIAAPLVFARVTRPNERRRGHHQCATGLRQLLPECLDRFHDDLESVVDDLFAHATLMIENLEGWLTMRMPRATVNGYRRRRGARGAAQRPRVPVWLATELANDPWLVELARAILDWVGVEATAGALVWPLTAWADRKAALTGEHARSEAAIANDVQAVLTAMRRRPAWYQKNVEQPLGRKSIPVWSPSTSQDGEHYGPEPLVLVPVHEQDDALLHELAAAAIELISRRLARGEDASQVVPDVLTILFGELETPLELDQPGEQAGLLADQTQLDQIVATVLDLIQVDEDPAS